MYHSRYRIHPFAQKQSVMQSFRPCPLLAAIGILFHTATILSAQEGVPLPAPVVVAPILRENPVGQQEKPLDIHGFVDAYYQYNLKDTYFPTSFTQTDKSITPGMANIVFSKAGTFGFVADIGVGPRAEAANGYAGTSLAIIKQLYISWAVNEAVSLTLGNFSTHVGYELIDAPANFHYSTSYLFSNGPFYHTGLKATVKLSSRLALMAGIFNDTDTKIDEVSGKHVGAQLAYGTDRLSIYLNYIGGKQDDSNPADEQFANQVDLTASAQITEDFSVALNASVKSVGGAVMPTQSWSGLALYAKHAIADKFAIGVRGELVDDPDGIITGITNNRILSLTLSGNADFGPVTLIPEFRMDQAQADFLSDGRGDLVRGKVPALLMAVVYRF